MSTDAGSWQHLKRFLAETEKGIKEVLLDSFEWGFVHNTDDPVGMFTGSYAVRFLDNVITNEDPRFLTLGFPGEDEPAPLNWHLFRTEPEDWERIKERLGTDRYVVHMERTLPLWTMSEELGSYLQDDEEIVVVNPIAMRDQLNDKDAMFRHFEETDLPVIPTMRGDLFLEADEESIRDRLGSGDRGFIVKPVDGRGGFNLRSFDSAGDVRSFLEEIEGSFSVTDLLGTNLYRISEALDRRGRGPGSYIVQPMIPHDSDVRIIRVGDMAVNGERRYAKEDGLRTNLSTAIRLGRSSGETTLENAGSGRVDSLYMGLRDRDGLPDGVRPVPERAKDLSAAVARSFDPETFRYDPDLPQQPVFMAIDFLEVDPDDLDHLPARYRDRVADWTEGDTAYLIAELNEGPDATPDHLASLYGMPEQLTAVHLLNLLYDLAGLEQVDLDDVLEGRAGPLSRRLERYYLQPGDAGS